MASEHEPSGQGVAASGVAWLPRCEIASKPVEIERVGAAAIEVERARVQDRELWEAFDHRLERGLSMLDTLRSSHVGLVTDAEFDRTETVLRRAHAVHGGLESVEPFDYAFVVPTRTSTWFYSGPQGDDPALVGRELLDHPGMEYREELEQTIPFVDRLDPLTRTQLCSAIPPTIIDRYDESPAGCRGAIVYAPLTIDRILSTPDRRTLRDIAVAEIGAGLDFAQRVGGASFAGLGAFFPSLTRYGRQLERPGMRLTTGHAGTIAMMAKTLERILGAPGYEDCVDIGIVGAGAIGTATADHLAATTDHRFVIFDTAVDASRRLAEHLNQHYGDGRASTVDSMQGVCDAVRVVMAATTTPVPFDELTDVSALHGLVIVDDSEPGAFNDGRYREAGARPVGVVGEVPLELGRRTNGFNYGRELAAPHHVYGCEAEVKTMAELGLQDDGITRRAEPADVAFIADCFDRVGVRASPLQHRGVLELLVDDADVNELL